MQGGATQHGTPGYCVVHQILKGWVEWASEHGWGYVPNFKLCLLKPPYLRSVEQHVENGWGISVEMLVSMLQTHLS